MTNRLTINFGKLLRQAALTKLGSVDSIALFDSISAKYQSNTKGVTFQVGKAKLESAFPNIGIEIISRQDPFAALNHTKDITIRYSITVALKTLPANNKQDDKFKSIMEDYLIEMAELAFEILNLPGTLQYTLTQDDDGNALQPPIKIYDSRADSITYGTLYNGALRIATIQWWAKAISLGPITYGGDYNRLQ